VVSVDSTGVLVSDGKKVFPINVSQPPPLSGKTVDGQDAFKELASGGVTFMRVGQSNWDLATIDAQLDETEKWLKAAADAGMRVWLWLGEQPVLSGPSAATNQQVITKIVNRFKNHPGLGAYKGIDEPHNPVGRKKKVQGKVVPNPVDPQGMAKAYKLVKQLDPGHPVVIIHEPVSQLVDLKPYAASGDVFGADIYPVSYPPGAHAYMPRTPANQGNRDLSLVGDLTDRIVQAAGPKKMTWMTLQIAWSGVSPTASQPGLVPRFPSLFDERFMAYHAIVCGARGLTFFGGHVTDVMRPRDAKTGWNWTFWDLVLRPLLEELRSTAVAPILVAPNSNDKIAVNSKDIDLVARRDGGFLYVVAVRRGGPTSQVTFSGLPKKIGGGQVLFEYTQDPLPVPNHAPAGAVQQSFRGVSVDGGSFRDWFAPHDVHVYRFQV
jgi:hypothetical protein